jgi:hypothetical protein
MKTRDYLTILATTQLATSLEAFSKKRTQNSTIKHLKIISYTNSTESSTICPSTASEQDRNPSPNSRCGFATGNAC